MKFNHILMTSSLITITPVTAFAHKVPYGGAHCAMSDEEAAFEEIPVCTQEEKEEAAATAFCNFIGRPDLDNCVRSIINHGMAEAAGECVDEALQKQVALKDEIIGHKTGGGNHGDAAHWHIDYKYSKENGLHRHDWSEAAREKAGMENGATAVRLAKESSATNKSTTETSTSSSVFGKFLVGIGFKGVGNADHEVGGEHTKSNGKATESGPLSESEVKEIYDKAFSQAKADPNLTTVNPNITCEKGEAKCSTSFSRNYPNEDYKPHAQKPTSNQSDGGSGNTSGDQGSSSKPTPPPSKSTTDITPPTSSDHEKKNVYAGDPSPVTKPDEMLATYDSDNLNSPVSKCLLESFKKEISKDASKTYNPDGPNLTPEQRKKEAQGLLRNGICDTKYYGQSFCQKHKTMRLTGGQIQDPQGEKTTLFEELKDRVKMNFGNPADFLDTNPIEFSRIPKASPEESALIGILGPRGRL